MTWQTDYIRKFDEVAIRHGWRDAPLPPLVPEALTRNACAHPREARASCGCHMACLDCHHTLYQVCGSCLQRAGQPHAGDCPTLQPGADR